MDTLQKNTSFLTPIEVELGVDENGMTTARALYDFLELGSGQFSRWSKTHIENNEFYEEGRDWVGFDIVSNGYACKDYRLSTDFAKHLCMESHSSKGKIARQYFVNIEERVKQKAIDLTQLSPELQMFNKIFQSVAAQQLEQKRQAKKIAEVENRVDSIREVVSLDTTSWRDDTGKILKKIGTSLGGGQMYSQVRNESYELLEKRAHADLNRRLVNRKRAMAEEGVSKSKRERLTYVDIIADDVRLIEVYTAIVKEMAIRYGVA